MSNVFCTAVRWLEMAPGANKQLTSLTKGKQGKESACRIYGEENPVYKGLVTVSHDIWRKETY
jgi:hypothetical protein